MARRAFGLSVTSTGADCAGVRDARATEDPVRSVATTAVEAAVAVLEADAGSPTAQHVIDLRAVWNTFVAGAGGIPSASSVVLSFDQATVGSKSVLREAARRLVTAAEGSGGLNS